MSYIYDILLNLNNVILDFYDWNEDDKVVHIKKAPIFLVNTKFINDLTYNKLKISQSLMSKIYNKTEIYTNKDIKNIKYLAIFSDGATAVAVKFNIDGINQKKSKFLIDEDIEINNLACHLKKTVENYKLISVKSKDINKTRFQQNCYNYIFNILKNMDNNSEIKYLNYELFSVKSSNKSELVNNIKKNFNQQYLKIYNFFKLIATSK